MKIVLTEEQHKRLVGTQPINESEIDQYQLKKVAFSIWNNMKKNGERPALLDIIYDLIGAQRNSYRDYFEVRPIWYEYNGGMGVLMEKLKEEILGKTFELKDPNMGLDTKFRIKELDMNLKHTWPSKFIELVCEVDKNGIIEYETYDDESNQVIQNRDTIEQALYELEYEQDDLENFLKGILRSNSNHSRCFCLSESIVFNLKRTVSLTFSSILEAIILSFNCLYLAGIPSPPKLPPLNPFIKGGGI